MWFTPQLHRFLGKSRYLFSLFDPLIHLIYLLFPRKWMKLFDFAQILHESKEWVGLFKIKKYFLSN